MESFISETLDKILHKQTSFEKTVIILPSQRAGVFVKEALKKKMSPGFLPKIIHLESFIEEVSKISKADSIQLLFHFYTVYKETESKPESFDSFSSWAFTAIQDFNEVDQHLIDSKEIFNYLKDIQRLKEWSVDKPLETTQLMKSHFSFMENLGIYYAKFYHYLTEKRFGYQGLLYREATKKINSYCIENKDVNFIIMGFNALNKAEEYLFQEMLSHHKTDIYWDIHPGFLKNKNQAGKFIRNYASQWNYYQKNKIKTSNFKPDSSKKIEVIGASKNITQIKYAGELINKLPNLNNTAVVLADESLLPVTLSSLPKKVAAVNITMGYPLKNTPIASLFSAIFQLFLTQEKLHKTATKQFYYKDVIRFFKHPSIQPLLIASNKNIFEQITNSISSKNDTFISQSQITGYINELEEKLQKCINAIFAPYSDAANFIDSIISLIYQLRQTDNKLNKEYLYRFYTAFVQLKDLQTTYKYFTSLKTIHHFFNQMISLENISFQGEPLQGLQLMGMLETRVLDFENIIITSVNENILPANSTQNSFIPFDVKIEFGIPTYREKDAIYAYHFFRLIQRAKNIYLLYNSESDSFGGGEKSRFITQLLQNNKELKEQHISPQVTTEQQIPKEVFKDKAVLNRLKEIAAKGFSPSALTNYLYNPFEFYKQKVLKLKEYKEVEETVAYNTMGTIIHDTLEALYKPFTGQFITAEDLTEMNKKVNDWVIHFFKLHFHSSDVFTGKNRLIFEVSKNYVIRFLEMEKNLVASNRLKIIATEQNLDASISIEGLDFPIRIHGQVDRIDELNGVTRIIDYKSGMVTKVELKASDLNEIIHEKYSKAIQVLLYAYLYTENNPKTNNITGGIISFKNLKSGLLQLNFAEKRGEDFEISQERLEEFIENIKTLILEIFNPETPFTEKIK